MFVYIIISMKQDSVDVKQYLAIRPPDGEIIRF